MVAAGVPEAARAFIEIGTLICVLAVLSRIGARLGITAIPLYLVVGLLVGERSIFELPTSGEFISIGAEIGVLLLLLTLGLEYSDTELRAGLRTGIRPGLADLIANATPGVIIGVALGWEPIAAVLLGGITWISSSGIISKVLSDLGRLGFRETPTILNTLVIEDLAMAVYLPIVGGLIVGGSLTSTVSTVAVAIAVVSIVLVLALRYGGRFSSLLGDGSDETVLLAVFGITLVVAGIAQRLEVSGAIGAFLVGLAISGTVQERAAALMRPLRDLFAAVFFVFFAIQIELGTVVGAAPIALLLVVITAATKIASGWYAAGRAGIGPRGRLRAGTMLIARGEFSIVIAALGASLVDGPDLAALAAGYVLASAVIGTIATRFADRIPLPRRRLVPPASSSASVI